jgi:hypothetical protein
MSYSIAGFVRDTSLSRLAPIRGPEDVARICNRLCRTLASGRVARNPAMKTAAPCWRP